MSNITNKSQSILEVYANQLKLDVTQTTDGISVNIPIEILVAKSRVVNKFEKNGADFKETDIPKHVEITGVDATVAKLLTELKQPISSLQPLVILVDPTPENLEVAKRCEPEMILKVSDYYGTAKIVKRGQYSNLDFDLRATKMEIAHQTQSTTKEK
ncbi:hypothetical protein ACFJX1_07770 [Enterococcus faecalis]|nr:hypothetical protein [Enterococcus faecalis]